MWKLVPALLAAASLANCDREDHATTKEIRDGYLDIVSPSQRNSWTGAMPEIADREVQSIINSIDTMWYDKSSVVPGYQDSFGDPKGMRPNTVRRSLIDTAVPGGHARLFKTKGQFHFPFGTGGLDDSSNAHNAFFWHLPKNSGGNTVPVAWWKESFSRWKWVFPVGTVLGEVLFLDFPDGSSQVFEVRVRKRTATTWTNDIFRPFPTAESMADRISSLRPDWQSSGELTRLIQHLRDPSTLEEKSLTSTHFSNSIDAIHGAIDDLPVVNDPQLYKSLLGNTPFVSVKNKVWKQSGDLKAFAASTSGEIGIVPNNYDGGLFPVNDEFCSGCHDNAGRAIGDFHDDLAAYGELWGEDETFSWHLFETSMFVDSTTGRVRNWNDDNRRIRQDFKDAKVVAPFVENGINNNFYRQLPRTWTYRPF